MQYHEETSAEVIKTLLQHCPTGPEVPRGILAGACEQQHPKIISILLEPGGVDLNEGIIEKLPLLTVIR
jgi:hypothetical protein